MPRHVIDLTGEDSDPEISWNGYKRNVSTSKLHSAALEKDGLVYMGFNASSVPAKRKSEAAVVVDDSDDDSDQLRTAAPLSKVIQRHMASIQWRALI